MKDIAWSELSFGYMPTDYNVRCCYRDGKWGEIEVCSDEYLKLHMAATCLHYGQEAFEGLKAYRCPDGKVRVFRVEDNAARLQSTCRGIMMPELPTELFVEMVKKVVRLNQEYIPTYESGATLYIRPFMFATEASLGVHMAKSYKFVICIQYREVTETFLCHLFFDIIYKICFIERYDRICCHDIRYWHCLAD